MNNLAVSVPPRSFNLSLYFFAAVILALWCLTSPSVAQERSYPRVHSVDGAVIFRDYCASCHGVDGKGQGPVAPALRSKVPDLTLIMRRAAGEFPRVRIRNIIEGTESPVAHGSREMPVWGPVFHQIDADQDLGNVRVDNLATYIQSIQRK